MKREIILTADGSHTIAVPEAGVTYHSLHGAVQESRHVFIKHGLHFMADRASLAVFEMGFGTGLNALLTAIVAQELQLKISYLSVENYPISVDEASKLNYGMLVNEPELFELLHRSPWGENVPVDSCFSFKKLRESLDKLSLNQSFDLVYYDAFAPAAQPELWTPAVFQKIYSWLLPGGALVTYCSKGDVRRAMAAAGLLVEKLPGPPGKREMVRARRPG